MSIANEKRYPRPHWIAAEQMEEEDLCPECFKAVGVKSRYKLICTLAKCKNGATVTELTGFLRRSLSRVFQSGRRQKSI